MNSTPEKDRKMLTIIVIVVAILVIAQTINNVIQIVKIQDNKNIVDTNEVEYLSIPKGIGSATYYGSSKGTTNMCINNPPSITYDCNLTNAVLNTSITYNCTFNATDANNDNISFQTKWMTTPIIFNVTSNGYFNFSPKRTAMYQVNILRLFVYDDSGCANNNSYIDMNMTVVGTNHAPYLSKIIPNEKIVKGDYLQFNLNDYFTDPDDDVLAYFYVPLGGNTIKTKVTSHTAEIRAISCGNSTLYFTAVDPFGLSNISNIITYEVTCPNDENKSNDNKQGENTNIGGGSTLNSCMPNWVCGKWSECQSSNTTYRRCIDYNGCNPDNYEQFLFENCTYIPSVNLCEEKWDCDAWSTCKNDMHSRLCLDLNTCGTNRTKPLESENCSKISSCFNGIQDPGETGVDCGGPCGACRNIEKPAQVNNVNTVIIIVGALTFGTVGMLIYIFRSKIIAIYKKIMAKKPKIKHKVYINNKQKDKLLQLLNIMQVRLDEHKINHAIDESSFFVREYFKQLLSVDNLNQQELIANIIKLKDKDLEKILVMFYAKIINTIHLRNKGVDIHESEMQALLDEMSHEIYLVAEFTDQEAANSIKIRGLEGKEPLDSIYNKLSNLYIALKFGELIVAKSMYKDLLKEYEKLTNKDKRIPYNDIIRAFHAINYLEIEYTK